METLTRKQRQLRERELLILDVAREMLIERGYLGLTMDRIAAATEYSKGTIYQHFSCKEEVLAALLLDSMDRRAALFERAATFRGSARERLTAVGFAAELLYHLYPHHVQAEQVVKAASIRAKTSEQRQQAIGNCEFRCMGVITGLVRDGIAAGDLELPEGFTAEEVCISLWSLTMGFQVLRGTDVPFGELGVADPAATQKKAGQLMLDGLCWRPLSGDHDYAAAAERAGREVFAAELELLARPGL